MQLNHPALTAYKGKVCLVTGASGFIGTALTTAFNSLGARTVLIDLNHCDITCYHDLHSVWHQHKPQHIFHLAARTEVRQSFLYPRSYYNTNVQGTLNVLECHRTLTPAAPLVVASTDKVYGQQDRPCAETDPLTPTCHYSASKILADIAARSYASGHALPVTILRCANTYGPGQHNTTTLITNTIKRLLAAQPPTIHDPSAVREWLYIDDAVTAYLLCGLRTSPGGNVYNVGSGQRYAVAETVNHISALLGTTISPTTNAAKAPQIHHQGLNSAKFRTAYPDWAPTPFSVGLAHTINYYKRQANVPTVLT